MKHEKDEGYQYGVNKAAGKSIIWCLCVDNLFCGDMSRNSWPYSRSVGIMFPAVRSFEGHWTVLEGSHPI